MVEDLEKLVICTDFIDITLRPGLIVQRWLPYLVNGSIMICSCN